MAAASSTARAKAAPRKSPALESKIAPFTKEEELNAYREMLLIRRFEEKAGQLYGMGLIGGFCHLYIGQEAVVVGMQMAAQEGDQTHHQLSRPWPYAGLRHGPEGRHGRIDGPAQRPFQRQGRLDAHVLAKRSVFTAATASSARRCRSGPGSPSPTAIAATEMSASLISATARPTRARSTRASTWPSSGSCRSSLSSRTTATRWARQSTRSSALTDFSKRGQSFNIPGEQVDGMDVRAVQGRGGARGGMVPRRQWSDHSRDADLSLSRPFDVGPGEIPLQGRSAEDARGA